MLGGWVGISVHRVAWHHLMRHTSHTGVPIRRRNELRARVQRARSMSIHAWMV